MIDKSINIKKIDLSGVSFPTSDASTCALIFTAVRNTYGFPLYLTNFKINDEKRDSVLVNPIILENQTIINLNDCHLVVTPTEISVGKGVYETSLESIVDKDDNPRFVEGDITMEAIEGVTQTYGKWSLSGTHLMIVLRGDILNGTALPSGTTLANVNFPNYINNKIITYPQTTSVEYKTFDIYNSSSGKQQIEIRLRKLSNLVAIQVLENATITDNRSFRIQFDLLIDAE